MIKTPLSTVIGGAFWTPGATVINGAKLSFVVMEKLFANGEQGFWYDPNDLSTMFQDAAGTVPVAAVGQAVGLMLDKSKGLALGSELNTNDFSTNLNGWTAGASVNAVIDNAEARITFNAAHSVGSGSWFRFASSYTGGKLYTISFDATYVSGGDLLCGISWGVGGTVLASQNAGVKQRYSRTVSRASSENMIATFGATTVGSVWKISNVSVKEVLGNHAYQTTSSMRPLLVASPQRLDYDIADDKLITALPAQLTGCTVVRAVPNVGTQILTGQTIPATYEDNTDHCGLIVINRALTPSETSAITAEFNKRAGV